jgi:hypothetical protein
LLKASAVLRTSGSLVYPCRAAGQKQQPEHKDHNDQLCSHKHLLWVDAAIIQCMDWLSTYFFGKVARIKALLKITGKAVILFRCS